MPARDVWRLIAGVASDISGGATNGVPAGVPFSNQGGYANPDMDALIDKAAVTIDRNEFRVIFPQNPPTSHPP